MAIPSIDAIKHKVEERFRKANLNDPVTSLLFGLALEKEQARMDDEADFIGDIHAPMPDAAQYMKMKGKISLLPLDTIKERIKLPSVPGAIFQLEQAISDGASSERLASIIRADPKLAAVIMSLVNSPLYAQKFKIETLSRAITLIGTREVSSLALGVRVASMFEDSNPQGLPLEPFWKHSIACAVLAHEIAVLCGKADPEKYLVAGLLHDMGRVMLFSRYPDVAKVALALHHKKGDPLHELELWLFDVDHCMIGGLFFGEWGLPKGVVHSALYHHDPEMCAGKEVPEVVYAANQIATALGVGCNRTYALEPGRAIWGGLNLDEAALRAMILNVDKKLWGMFRSMFQPSGA